MNIYEKIMLIVICAFIFLSLFASLQINMCEAAPIDERELRNDFTNDNWFQASENVLRNSTLNSYQLNKTGVSIENFNTWTEVDTNNLLTVNDNLIEANGNMRYLNNHFVYRSLDVEKTDFTHYFSVYVDSIQSLSATHTCGTWRLTNSTEDAIYDRDNNFESVNLFISSASSDLSYYFYFSTYENGVSSGNGTSQIFARDTWYYVTVERVGAKYTISFYSDYARTTKITDINFSPTLYKYNKLYIIHNVGYATNKDSNVFVGNLSLGLLSGYDTDGMLYFKNLLENTTYNGIWYLTNQTLNSQTLQVSISNDNSTWLMNTTLNDGCNCLFIEPFNYTTLYIRYRFIGNGLNTPYLLNASLIHKNICIGGLTSNNNWWLLVSFICLPSIFILWWWYKK